MSTENTTATFWQPSLPPPSGEAPWVSPTATSNFSPVSTGPSWVESWSVPLTLAIPWPSVAVLPMPVDDDRGAGAVCPSRCYELFGVTPLFSDERVEIFAEDGLLLCGWRGVPTLSQMEAMEVVGRAWEAEHVPTALLNIAFSGRPNFADAVRNKATELTRDASLFGLARAHVVLIPGLAGTAVRAFMNTFILLGRPPHPTRAFGSAVEASAWLLPMLADVDAAWTAQRVEACVARLREHTVRSAAEIR